MKKLFVGSLPWAADDQKLRELFEKFGAIVSVTVLKDRETGRSRGFGFVEFSDDAAADAAIREMDGVEVDGRKIVVNEARPQTNRP